MYVTPEGWVVMVIFVSNCYQNFEGVRAIALLLCNSDCLVKCIFPATSSRQSLKSSAFSVCMCLHIF